MNSFKIKNISAFSISLGGSSSYWENYKNDQNSLQTARFVMKKGWQTVYANNVESVIIRVELDDGTIGWGEPNTPIAPEVITLLVNKVVSEIVIDKEFKNIQEVSSFIYKLQSGRGYFAGYWQDVIAAIDIAIWDAIGKRDKFRVFEKINFSPQNTFPVYLSGLRQSSLKKRKEKLISMMDDGLQGVKIFLNGEISECINEIKELKKSAYNIKDFMVDMLWSCDYETAKNLKLILEELEVKFLECPLQPEDLKGHIDLVKEKGTKIAIGEHFRSKIQILEWLKNKALDIFQPDIGRTGITGFVDMKKECDKYAIPITIHMGNGLSVFQAATLSCAASYSQTFLQEFQEGLANQFIENNNSTWKYKQGNIISSTLYGIGVNDKEIYDLIEKKGIKN